MSTTKTERLRALNKAHVWQPFTQMLDWNEGAPLIIEAAEGNELIDTDGRRYLDGVSSLWTNVHGHRHPVLNRAIAEQLEKVAHSTMLGLGNVPATELAAALVGLAPEGLARVFYSDSGSTSVEIALKMAFQFWQHVGQPERRRFVSLRQAYHGDTVGAVSVGGIDLFHGIFGPLLFESVQVETPFPYRHPAGPDSDRVRDACLADLDRVLDERKGEVAAMIVEPLVQGAAGMIVHPPGFLAGVQERCREYDVLLIADEVATGFGRTGTMFACEQEAVRPDFLCMAKGISGGYLPLAATLATDRVFEAFLGAPDECKQFFHGHTYTGNPVACAAALASLQVFESEEVLASLPGKVRALEESLGELAGHGAVGDVRQRGLMVGVELVADRETREPFAAERRVGAEVCQRARAHGVIVRPLGDVVILMPPLSCDVEELRRLVRAVGAALEDVGL